MKFMRSKIPVTRLSFSILLEEVLGVVREIGYLMFGILENGSLMVYYMLPILKVAKRARITHYESMLKFN